MDMDGFLSLCRKLRVRLSLPPGIQSVCVCVIRSTRVYVCTCVVVLLRVRACKCVYVYS